MNFPFVSDHFLLFSMLTGSMFPSMDVLETPFVARIGHAVMATVWNCIAAFSYADVQFKLFGPGQSKDRTFEAPHDHHTSDARMLCAANAFASIIPSLGNPKLAQTFLASGFAEIFGFGDDHLGFSDNIKDLCKDTFDREACIRNVVAEYGWDATLIGEALAWSLEHEFAADDWNARGTCGNTKYCVAYADTTGWNPADTECVKRTLES